MGDVGTGKTHMAEALCVLACQSARPARFFTASSLVDELGFLPLDADGARPLFQMVSQACETQSVVFTTSLEFSRWGVRLRRRPDGRRRDRPRRPPRQAPAVQGRVLPREARAHAVALLRKRTQEG